MCEFGNYERQDKAEDSKKGDSYLFSYKHFYRFFHDIDFVTPLFIRKLILSSTNTWICINDTQINDPKQCYSTSTLQKENK